MTMFVPFAFAKKILKLTSIVTVIDYDIQWCEVRGARKVIVISNVTDALLMFIFVSLLAEGS